MVHKKYTYKKGKRFGPYYYETKRVNGEVVTTYLGSKDPSKKNKKVLLYAGLTLGLVLLLLAAVYFPNLSTGNVSLDINDKYIPGEVFKGNLKLNLKAGELIPANSKVIVSVGELEEEFFLSELVSKGLTNGSYYAEGLSLNGSGDAFGLLGKKKVFPEVDFEILVQHPYEESASSISSDEDDVNESETDNVTVSNVADGNVTVSNESVSNVTGTNESLSDEEISNQTTSNESSSEDSVDVTESEDPEDNESESDVEEDEETVEEVIEESEEIVEEVSEEDESEEVTEESEGESSGITGNVVGAFFSFLQLTGNSVSDLAASTDVGTKISGSISKDEVFTRKKETDQSVKIIEGSVKVNGEQIDENNLDIKIKKNEFRVTTDYFIVERGFGVDYLSNDKFTLEISLEDFGITVGNESEIRVQLVYNNETLIESSKNLTLIVQNNQSNDTSVNETLANVTISNVSIVNNTAINSSLVNITQYGAVLGKPVRWVREVKIKGATNLTVEIPASADNITVEEVVDETSESVDVSVDSVNGSSDEMNVTEESEEVEVIEESAEEVNESEENITFTESTKISITGEVSAELDLDEESIIIDIISRLFGRITGNVVENVSVESLNESVKEVKVEANESLEKVRVEYYTAAPYVRFEEELEDSKRIGVGGPSDVHYENVLLFTDLNESLEIIDSEKIRIYWEEEGSYIEEYNASDRDGNGIYDYVEWVSPHLSNQTFEIITVTRADHLNSSGDFISNIYGQVKELDDDWSEKIYSDEYVRVIFEENLSNGNNLAVYVRGNEENTKLEVYYMNTTDLIGSFDTFEKVGYHSITLSGLNEDIDRLDLKIVGENNNSYIEFDNIFGATKDCSDFFVTDNGIYYCVDDEVFYSCEEFVDLNSTSGDELRCSGANYVTDTLTKEHCPFNHEACDVTVDMNYGWGARQYIQDDKYKVGTFHENFHCGMGHCEVPFYLKSNISLVGNLTFDASASLNSNLSNISVVRVLDSGNESDGKIVSMEQYDSNFYLVSFDYVEEYTNHSIKSVKPVKFNISAYLDGEKILDLDPVAFGSNAGGTSWRISTGMTWTHAITCGSGMMLVVGVAVDYSYDDQISAITYNGDALIKLDSLQSADRMVSNDFWYMESPDCGASYTISVTSSLSEDAAGTSSVYTGVGSIDTGDIQTNVCNYCSSSSITVTADSDQLVVDMLALDYDPTANTGGDNQQERGEYDEGQIQISTSDGSDTDGSVIMSWSGFNDEIAQIGVPLTGGAPGNFSVVRYIRNSSDDIVATLRNSTDTANLSNADNYTITLNVNQTVADSIGSISANVTDIGLNETFVIIEDAGNISDLPGGETVDDHAGDSGTFGTLDYDYNTFYQYFNDSNNTGGTVHSVGFFDYNEDGVNEAVVFGGTGVVTAFNSTGNMWNYSFGGVGADALDIEVFDNGTGFNNTIAFIDDVGSTPNGSLMIINKNGGQICTTADLGTARSLTVGDFDRDGLTDELAVGTSSDVEGFDSKCAALWTSTDPGNAVDVQVADLLGSGFKSDIITAETGNDYVAINGTSGLTLFSGTNIAPYYLHEVAVVNHDGNAGDDFLFGSYSGILAYSSTGSNLWNYSGGSSETDEIRFGNFKGEDAIVRIYVGDGIDVVNYSGSLIFPITGLPSIDTRDQFSLAIGDLNGDGLDDIVAGGNAGWVMAYDNDGDVLWNYSVGVGGIGAVDSYYADGAIEIGDVDGDGFNDVAFGSNNTFGYVLYANRTDLGYSRLWWNPHSGKAMSNMSQNSTANFSYVIDPLSLNGTYDFNFSAEGGISFGLSINNSISFHTAAEGGAEDVVGPSVTALIPSINAEFGLETIIEISANVTDADVVDSVSANITLPNGTINEVILSNTTGFGDKFNNSYTIPILNGDYNITFVANDSSNNLNVTEVSNFTAFLNCSTLDDANIVYSMARDVTSSGTCFTISGNNITLDGGGYTITYGTGGTGIGISVGTSSPNFTVKNSNIVKGAGGGGNNYGVWLNGADDSTVYNNVISTDGTSGNRGVYIQGDSMVVNITKNNITTTGSSSSNDGVDATSGVNFTTTENIISTNGTSSNSGIVIPTGSSTHLIAHNIITTNGTSSLNSGIALRGNHSEIINNTIISDGTSSNQALVFVVASFNNATNNTLRGLGSGDSNHGLYVTFGSRNNYLWGNNVTKSTGGNAYGIRLENSDNTNNTFRSNIIANSGNRDFYIVNYGGNETKFIDQNLTDYNLGSGASLFSVKNTHYGRIDYLEVVSGSETNLSNDVRFGNNSVTVESITSTGLNSSANITLFGIGERGFPNPDILRDGAICDTSTTPSCFNFTALNDSTVIFNVSSWTEYSIGDPLAPTACYDALIENGVYTHQNDFSTTGDCINVLANNVTINFNGFLIDGDDGGGDYGVTVNGYNDAIIFNGTTTDFGRGISLSSSYNATVYNMNLTSGSYGLFLGTNAVESNITNIFGSGSTTQGFFLTGSDNNLVRDVNFRTGNFYLLNSDNNIVTNATVGSSTGSFTLLNNADYNVLNDIVVRDATLWSLYMLNSDNNNLTNINASNEEVQFIGADDNIIINLTINNSPVDSLIVSSDRNTFTNLIILNPGANDELLLNAGAEDNVFIDSTIKKFDINGVNFTLQDANASVYFFGTASEDNSNLNFNNGSAAVIFGNNSVTVDSVNAPGLNVSANVTLYDIHDRGFTSPIILIDGVTECTTTSSPSCSNFTDLNVENVKFNVSSWSVNFSIGSSPNNAPNSPSPSINSTDGSNKTLQDLNCFDTITDNDSGDELNVTVRWYREDVLNLTIDANSSYANATAFNTILVAANTTKGEDWHCSLRLHDGSDYSSWVNSSNVTILNSPPTVTLLRPFENETTTDRDPTFNWTGSDDDSDTLTYDLNVSLFATSLCSEADRYDTGLNETNFTASPYLKCLQDNGDYYNWSVRANDGEEDGSYATYINFSIQSNVSITLDTNFVNFGQLNLSDADDTTDGSPAPMVLRSTGTVLMNISVNFSSLFDSDPSPTSNYQYKIRNLTDGCFFTTGTQQTFANSPTSATNAIHKLNFTAGLQAGCSNASIDLSVTIPPAEVDGNKSSTITFVSSLAE